MLNEELLAEVLAEIQSLRAEVNAFRRMARRWIVINDPNSEYIVKPQLPSHEGASARPPIVKLGRTVNDRRRLHAAQTN